MGVFVGVSVRYAACKGYTAGGDGVCGIGEVSDVVAFRFTVVDCPSRAPFRLLVARLIRCGVGDEPMSR